MGSDHHAGYEIPDPVRGGQRPETERPGLLVNHLAGECTFESVLCRDIETAQCKENWSTTKFTGARINPMNVATAIA